MTTMLLLMGDDHPLDVHKVQPIPAHVEKNNSLFIKSNIFLKSHFRM